MTRSTDLHIVAGVVSLVALGLSFWAGKLEDDERRELSDIDAPPVPKKGPCAPCLAAALRRQREAEAARLAETEAQTARDLATTTVSTGDDDQGDGAPVTE